MWETRRSQRPINRRTFVKKSALLAAATTGAGWIQPSPLRSQAAAAAPESERMIGIQIGAVSFVDEGVERVLDRVQELASVNTLFLPVMAFNRGLAGRQIPGEPLPDHGVQEYDTDSYRGGYYATIHPEYYRDTVIDPRVLRPPELGDFDMLAEVLPEAHARGMRVIAFLADNFEKDVPDAEAVLARDLNGK